MSVVTSDPNDPEIVRGPPDTEPTKQHSKYLVLSEEERAKGFVRPLRRAYIHVGRQPQHPLRPLTKDEHERYDKLGYVAFEQYPNDSGVVGRFWTQAQLDDKGCGAETKMGLALCETYARDPHFYGATYCVGCSKHLPVGEFVWVEDGERVGS